MQRSVRADEIASPQSATGRPRHRLARLRVGRVVGLRGTGRQRRLTLGRIDWLQSAGVGKARARGSVPSCRRRRARSAAPGRTRGAAVTFERRRKRSAPSTCSGAGERRRQRAWSIRYTLMRHQHVGSKTAVDGDTEMAGFGAQDFRSPETRRADAAADPGIHRNGMADDLDVGVGAGAFDHAGDLMTERERQGSGADVELPVAAEGEMSRPAGARRNGSTPQRLIRTSTSLPRGRWAVDDGLAQRRPYAVIDWRFIWVMRGLSRGQRTLRPQYPPPARSGRGLLFRAAEADRPRAISGSRAASCGAARRPQP